MQKIPGDGIFCTVALYLIQIITISFLLGPVYLGFARYSNIGIQVVQSSLNVMAHGDLREGR